MNSATTQNSATATDKVRYAFWKNGMIHVVGVNCSSESNFEAVKGIHEAAKRIREMVKIGLVKYGVLIAANGQRWNEKMELARNSTYQQASTILDQAARVAINKANAK